jgi:hypothetical protein
MKKIILTVALVAMASIAHANTDPGLMPLTTNNVADTNIRASGVEKVILVNSTTPALATDRSGNTMTSGLIYWVVRPSSAAIDQYLEIRDTNTANILSTRMLPWINAVSTSSLSPFAVGGGQVIQFDPPLPFYNGLSYNQWPPASTPKTGCEWSIGVRWKKR